MPVKSDTDGLVPFDRGTILEIAKTPLFVSMSLIKIPLCIGAKLWFMMLSFVIFTKCYFPMTFGK